MTAIAIIPARFGSRRIPRKNIRLFRGAPIISYSIATAKKSGLFERVVVSTESEEIADVAQDYGADVLMRPQHLADDPNVGTPEVTAHALRSIPCEYACCIHATAPLMRTEDLQRAYALLTMRPQAQYAFGASIKEFRDAGQFYFGRRSAFLEGRSIYDCDTIIVGIPEDRICDLDNESDWLHAERIYEQMMAVTV